MADHKKPEAGTGGEPVSACWNATSQYLAASGEAYFATVNGKPEDKARVARETEEGFDGMIKHCSRECQAAADDHAMLVSSEQIFIEMNGGDEITGVYPDIEGSERDVREVCKGPKLKGPEM